MAKKEFDPIDAALTVSLMVTGFIMVGIASFSLFGIDFGAEALNLGGTSISTAYLISALAVVGTVATNDNAELSSLKDDVTNLDDYYTYAIIGMAALMLAWLFVPQVPTFFKSADLWGLVFVGISTTGQFALGWIL